MAKIKLNLVSGAVVEKPLVSAFRANNNTYVVLDNEINGSMGLPIILVCKYTENKLIKIIDQNEWSIVKEYLKNIIAGNSIEFVSIPSELLADDIYYTQLTLPLPSFDTLKRTYQVEEPEEVNAFDALSMVEPVMEESIAPEMPVEETKEEQPLNAFSETFNIPAEEPVIPSYEEPIANPVPETPIIPAAKEEPLMESVVNEQSNLDNPFADQKEAFMKACENMFDALVQKFTKELENK